MAVIATIAQHELPLHLLRDLLSAFRQDVTKTHYTDFNELMDYFRRSANPIGRLALHLNRQAEVENLAGSDAICSALQLINHWQDFTVHWRKNGGYQANLPLDDLGRFGMGRRDIASQTRSIKWRNMMTLQCDRARKIMHFGAPLGNALRGRIGAGLRLIVASGTAILDKISAAHGDVFRQRPILTKWDWLTIGPRTVCAL